MTGLGLVTGLNGTGGNTPDTRTLAANLTQRLGSRINPLLRNALANDQQRKTDNVSVVLVTAELPVGARPGQRLDAIVSAMDDASSLKNGILAMTPLIGADENVYATASGMLSSNTISASGNGATVTKNHPTVARLPGGAVVEREVAVVCSEPKSIRLLLQTPDWDTVGRITDVINEVAPDTAVPENAGVVYVQTPSGLKQRADFIRLVTNLKVTPDISARVVINERSGTVTIGSNVKLSRVAISHGNLSVITGETPLVSQPMPFHRRRNDDLASNGD